MKSLSLLWRMLATLSLAWPSGCVMNVGDGHRPFEFGRAGKDQACDSRDASQDSSPNAGASLDAASTPDGTATPPDAGLVGDVSGTAAAVGSPSGPTVTACKGSSDCLNGQLCVGGYCLAPCTAHCQCPGGESCVAGYCAIVPLDPGKPCVVDCECPSGAQCLAGFCQ